jgi:hypothetical protein
MEPSISSASRLSSDLGGSDSLDNPGWYDYLYLFSLHQSNGPEVNTVIQHLFKKFLWRSFYYDIITSGGHAAIAFLLSNS